MGGSGSKLNKDSAVVDMMKVSYEGILGDSAAIASEIGDCMRNDRTMWKVYQNSV
jgi:hypothetical protein